MARTRSKTSAAPIIATMAQKAILVSKGYLMSRERTVKDSGGTEWTCVQAYAGLKEAPEDITAKLSEHDGRLPVTCTPRGGTHSVRLDLPNGWYENMSDEELLQAIQKQST